MGRVALRRWSIGLKLSTFIDTDDEIDIMSALQSIEGELPESITIKLWYSEGEIKKGELKGFMKRWGDLLAGYGSQLFCLNKNNQYTYKAWFNVFSRDDSKKLSNIGRFQYYIDDIAEIQYGIFSFSKVVKFHCKTDRFDNYQKRNNNNESRYRR